jgi:hypothetical protein
MWWWRNQRLCQKNSSFVIFIKQNRGSKYFLASSYGMQSETTLSFGVKNAYNSNSDLLTVVKKLWKIKHVQKTCEHTGTFLFKTCSDSLFSFESNYKYGRNSEDGPVLVSHYNFFCH